MRASHGSGTCCISIHFLFFFSAVILHNFNGFRTNLLRFRPVWMEEDSTLLLVLGLPFGQSVVMFVSVANFMNLLVTFFGCTVGFYALTINCVYAMWQQTKRKLETVFGGVCCGLGFVYKLMIKSFDYMRSAKASVAVATFQQVYYGTSYSHFPYSKLEYSIMAGGRYDMRWQLKSKALSFS